MSGSFWDLAKAAEAEVAAWPEWKRRAADRALCGRLDSSRPSRTKLATDLPMPPPLAEADLERLDREATKLRAAVEKLTSELDRLDDTILSLRLR